MAKKAKKNTPEVTLASFKDAATAALFGVDTSALGEVVFNERGVITVKFATTTATRVSDQLFKFVFAVDPASTPSDIEPAAIIEALKEKWEADDEATD